MTMALGKRLEAALKAKGLNQTRLAELSNTGTATIQAAIARDSERSKYALAWAQALGISLQWLTDGVGVMEDIESVKPEGYPHAEREQTTASHSVSERLEPIYGWDDSTPLDEDEVEIPLFKEVEMAAGSGTTHSVEINGRKLRFSKATMRAAGVDEASAACATVTGNSMERLILDGATVGVDRARTQILDGEIYAIDHDGMLRVKYVYRLPGGGLRLRSENREEHPDETLTAEEAQKVRVLGWVFWWSTVRRWRGK